MASIKFSATSTALAATSITVSLGGTPAVGDLVLVFLAVDNEIITHQPGWASEFTAIPNPWFPLDKLRAPDSSTLSGWYHTWNASDSGNSVVFSFVAAPTLGIGDKDVSSANALAIAVVFNGVSSTALLEHNIYGTAQDSSTVIVASPLKQASTMAVHAVFTNGSTASWTDSDSLAALVAQGTAATAAGMTLAVFQRVNSQTQYNPFFTLAGTAKSPMVQAATVSDILPQIYNSPYIEEGPMADNRLMFRYRINRYFTVLNNTGTFSAQRYLSTDQFDAATQVFRNNQPISSADRTNLLASGVGGDFRALS